MSAGAVVPLGNAFAMRSWPSIDSTESRNWLPWVRPVEKFRMPSAMTSSATPVTTPTVTGLRATPSPTRRQKPCVSSAAVSPTWGMKGQNGRRPAMSRIAGRKVSITTTATAMPIAPIGPRPAVPLTFASESDSSAAHTVRPDAKIAGPARRSAIAMASCLSSCRRSSSR